MAAIVPSLNMYVKNGTFETEWIDRHGAPESVSGDDEFDGTEKRKLGLFLESCNIMLRPRPVRRNSTLGILERKHSTVKRILERLQSDKSEATDAVLLSRALFLSNCFGGNHMLCSIQLAKGFAK